MKIQLKYLISSPLIAILGLVFLWYVPYLYPAHFFPFVKVYGFWAHNLICFCLLIIILFSRILSSLPSLKLKKFESGSINVPIISKKWLVISKTFVYAAFLMNLILVIHAYNSYTGNILDSKNSLKDFGGVNIISQFYLFFIIPYIIYSFQNKIKWNIFFLFLFVAVLFLRAWLYAERLALLEFVLPIILIFITIKNKKVPLIKLFKYFAIFLSVFILFELTRQISQQYGDKNIDIWFKLRWTLERFFNYYGDTQNKFYFVFENNHSFETTNYLDWAGRIFGRLIGFSPNSEVNIDFGKYHWRDYTNFGGLSYTYTDFGLILGMIFLISFFGFFFKLWFKLKEGSLYAWSVYPMYFIWIVEFPRYSGVFLNRFVVPFIIFNVVYLTFKNVRILKGKIT